MSVEYYVKICHRSDWLGVAVGLLSLMNHLLNRCVMKNHELANCRFVVKGG